MSEFKPMVKMMTDEPSVVLKLKKGGHVHMKEEMREEHGHKSMACDEHYSVGGKAPKKPSMAERRKAMNPNLYAKGGKVEGEIKRVEKELKHHEQEPAHLGHKGLKRGGKVCKAEGGSITASMDKTTVKGDAKRFVSDISTAERGSRAGRGTGDVKLGNAGYKKGGEVRSTINTAEHYDSAHGTGGVRMGAAGYKRGGKVHKAEGGEAGVGRAIEGNEAKFTKNNVTTGDRKDTAHGTKGVRLGNAGGYKKGGRAREEREDDRYCWGGEAGGKRYAGGGNVVDDGRAEKMPRHPKSAPVSNDRQSGTFKKGGKVARLMDGGQPPMPMGAASAPQGMDPRDAALLADYMAMQQQRANNAGYTNATRPVPTPGILDRMRAGLGFKHGGKTKK